MKKNSVRLLQELELKVKRKKEVIETFEQNPLSLFTELQDDPYLLLGLLQDANERYLVEYQNWQYPLVVAALTEKYDFEDYELKWHENQFPSPIFILENGYPIGKIKPYEQTFHIMTSESIMSNLDEYKDLSLKKVDLWKQLREKQIQYSNPFIYVGDAMIDNIKISLNKKKIRKQLEKEIEPLSSKIVYLQESIKRLELSLEQSVQSQTIEKEALNRTYEQLRRDLPLKLNEDQNEVVYEIQKEIVSYEQLADKEIEELQQKAIEIEQL